VESYLKVRPGRAFGFLVMLMPHEICEINMKSKYKLLFLPLLVLVIMASGTVWATPLGYNQQPCDAGNLRAAGVQPRGK
jgi:hypothetical protein